MRSGELTLASGRTLYLTSLRQSATYEGLVEGLPTREMNADTIAGFVEEARERSGHEPFVIQPVETPITHEGKYPFGEPARIPAIACVADFTSKGKTWDYRSSLTVIWFQDEYAFPLDASVESALLALDWDRLAAQSEI
jgi:hypothetical protein